jgi:hypothetical protein
VGGLVFFQQASTAARTSTMIRQLSATLAETRILVKGMAMGATPTDITSYLISAGAVPPDMVASATSLSNPFGGTTAFYAWILLGQQVINIDLTNVPKGVCTRLLTATSGSDAAGSTTLISSGYAMGSVWGTGVSGLWSGFSMNPTQAGWMCNYGSRNYPNKTIEPTSTPISGNVDMSILFRVER